MGCCKSKSDASSPETQQPDDTFEDAFEEPVVNVAPAVDEVKALETPLSVVDLQELDAPLSIAAARLSQWVYEMKPLTSEYVGTWYINYDVLNSVEADKTAEDIQKAIVGVTVTSAQQLVLLDASKRGWSCRVLFVVFRGTQCLQDWLQNAACVDNRVNFQAYGLGVHSGIWTYVANDFLKHGLELLDLVAKEAEVGTKMLVFTGHSLGGGLANVAHLLIRLGLDHPGKLPCHEQEVQYLPPAARQLLGTACALTFAAPMVFTPSESDLEIELLLRKHAINFVYNNDPVPRFPGEVAFIEEIIRGCGSLKIPLTQGVSVDVGSNISSLAAEVPALARYRHLGIVALIQGDGETSRGEVAEEIIALLREKRNPTEGGGIKNWWSSNAYDAGLDHGMERYLKGLSSRHQARNLKNLLSGTGVADLSTRDLGDGGVIAIGEAMRTTSNITCLLLSDNYISDVGATSVAACLQNNQKILRLDLSRNHIGDGGAAALALACQGHTSIGEINLRRNAIKEGGAKAFANALKENATLVTLDLSENHLRDNGAIALADALSSNQHLSKLCLALNQIGDAGATTLGDSLVNNTRLKILVLSCNLIGDAGATALAKTFKDLHYLRRLDLNDNNIGSVGEGAICDALRGWTPITVDLQTNRFQAISG